MPSPPNILKTTPPDDSYADMSHDELMALARQRGLDLPSGYVRNEVIAGMLREQDSIVSEGVPDLVEMPYQPARRYDVVYVARSHLIRMSRGEVVEIDGLKLAAEPGDFPPYWKLQS